MKVAMDVKVSVISGYYNRVGLVEKSVLSILDQSFKDFEYIIFDDGSTDGTRDVLKKIASKDNRVKLRFHNENFGFVRGMIDAIKSSKGKYIAVQGAGDISTPQRLEKQVDVLENNTSTVLVSSFFSNYDPESDVRQVVKMSKLKLGNEDFIKRSPISHGGVLFKSDEYINVGGYREIFKFSQDKDLWLRMSRKGIFEIIPEVLYERIVDLKTQVSFKPQKFILQYKYSELAKKVNGIADCKKIFSQIEELGIDKVIGSYAIPQKELFKRFLILFSKGNLSGEDFPLFLKNSYGVYYILYGVLRYFYNVPFLRSNAQSVYSSIIRRRNNR